MRQFLPLAGLTALALAVRLPGVARPGLSPDEPLTWLAVAGIDAHGLPLLPSGVLYERGFLYSFVCWIAGEVGGHRIEVYRLVSAIAGSCLPPLFFLAARRVGALWALSAAVVLALHPPLVAASGWARFYGPMTAMTLVVLLTMQRAADGAPIRWAAIATAAAGLLHDFTAILALTPLAMMAADPGRNHRTRLLRLLAATAASFAAVYIFVRAVKMLVPGMSALAAREKIAVQFVDALRSTPPILPMLGGVTAAAVVLLCVARPAKARRVCLAGLAVIACAVFAQTSSLVLFTDTPFSAGLPAQMLRVSMVYPWAAWSFLSRTDMPFLLLIVCTVAGALTLAEERTLFGRSVLLVVLSSLFLYGVVAMGFAERYFALIYAPAALAALAVFAGGAARERLAGGVLATLLLAWSASIPIGAAVHIGGSDAPERSWDLIREKLQGRILVCSDDIACSYFLRVPDVWLSTAESDRRRFSVWNGSAMVSVNTGATLAGTLDEIAHAAPASSRGVIVVAAAGRFDFPGAETVARLAVSQPGSRVIAQEPGIIGIEWFPAVDGRGSRE